MGVAFGRFIATDSYRHIRLECRTNHADQSVLALRVKTPGGVQVKCAGVAILDGSTDSDGDDSELVEVAVLGVEFPPYGELFPEHVIAYEERFKLG